MRSIYLVCCLTSILATSIGATPSTDVERARVVFQQAEALENQLDKDSEAIARLYQDAAKIGSVESIVRVGILYEEGLGVPQSYETAVLFYKTAVEQGSAQGLFRLGLCYFGGLGVAPDQVAAFGLILNSAEKGYAPAMTVVGNMYCFGQGTKISIKDGMDWLEKAALADDDPAAVSLGYAVLAYRKRDTLLARDWFEIAGMEGDAKALIGIADTFVASGKDYATDPLALKWLEMAIERGSVSATWIYAYYLVKSSKSEGRDELPLIRSAIQKTNLRNSHWILTSLIETEQTPARAVQRFFSEPKERLYVECYNKVFSKENPGNGRDKLQIVLSIKPKYPPSLKVHGKDGSAVVEMMVNEDGVVYKATAVQSSHPAFGENAVEAIKQWRFAPSNVTGRPGKMKLKIEVVFKLEESPVYTQQKPPNLP